MSESNSKKKESHGKPEWKPQVEFFTSLSADGRFVICKTVITAIKPVGYFEKVMQGKDSKPSRSEASANKGATESEGGRNDRGA